MESAAICAGVIGRYGDMVGVWMDPVTAQVMMTLGAGRMMLLRPVFGVEQRRVVVLLERLHLSADETEQLHISAGVGDVLVAPGFPRLNVDHAVRARHNGV